MNHADKITEVIMEVIKEMNLESHNGSDLIPIGISNRHIHLSQKDLELCFGEGYSLTPMKDLSQPGQFACKETMTLVGPRGAIEKVRILGPVRKETQVEILAADNFKLGINAPVRISGDLSGSSPLTIVGPKGSSFIKEGAIIAMRHIHMTLEDAKRLGVEDGEIVSIETSGDRGGIYRNVVIRANEASALDCHLDTEEANAMGLDSTATVRIIKL
jgi:propanediol utilization protein